MSGYTAATLCCIASREIFSIFFVQAQRSERVATLASLTWYAYDDCELTEKPRKVVVVNKRKRST